MLMIMIGVSPEQRIANIIWFYIASIFIFWDLFVAQKSLIKNQAFADQTASLNLILTYLNQMKPSDIKSGGFCHLHIAISQFH
jgi:hypothetical protein